MSAKASTADSGAPAGLRSRPWWPVAGRLFTVVVCLVVLGLVWMQARQMDWGAVLKAMREYDASTLAVAVAFSIASYIVYSSFDATGVRQLQLPVAWQRAAGIGFVSYAFNLNVGSLIGGVAMRIRLYAQARAGLHGTTQVLALSLITNWLGHLFVGGLMFVLAPIALPPAWHLGSTGLRLVGIGMLLAAVLYVLACSFSRRREWRWRGHTLRLPSARFALLQLAASSANWLLIAGILYTVLQGRIPYTAALSTLFIAAVAGVIVHVPAGLGVLETVFVMLLGSRMPRAELLAGLLAYRAIYYLLPLAVAGAVFFVLDRRGRARRERADGRSD